MGPISQSCVPDTLLLHFTLQPSLFPLSLRILASKMQIVNLSALSLFVASAFAADCFGNNQNGISRWADAYWDARAKMCGNKDCEYQKDCTTRSSKTIKGFGSSVTVNVSLSRKHTGSQKGFKDCWVSSVDSMSWPMLTDSF